MVLIALGSNRWRDAHTPPRAVLASAIAALRQSGLEVEACSHVWRTAPIGPRQPLFLNAVVRGRWAGSAADLLVLLHTIEHAHGRVRRRRWGPRVLDLDLLAVDGQVNKGPPILPHPRLHARAFVLVPLVEVAPGWRHPRLNRTARQLLARLPDRRGLRRWGCIPSPPAL
jgi:2-amino-4-hydroxy-6-hydroxymethyldihydropteridine diphosphokinase